MHVVTITLGLALVATQAHAQIGNPAGWAPDTRMEKPGVPAPNQTNYQDRLFVKLATAGGMAEVDLGRLALSKASHEGVKRFAQRMVDDHGKANEMLKAIAEKSKTPMPDGLDADHQQIRADLEKLDGSQFDQSYLSAQIVDHQKTAQILAWEIGQGEDAELQRFASQNLPTVLEHLRLARELAAELAVQASADPTSAAGKP